MRVLLDTSVLIGEQSPPEDAEAAISVFSITELHFGVLICDDDAARARRTARLAVVEATFEPLPVSLEVARVWGQLAAAVGRRGGSQDGARPISSSRRPPRWEGRPSLPRTSATSRSSMT